MATQAGEAVDASADDPMSIVQRFLAAMRELKGVQLPADLASGGERSDADQIRSAAELTPRALRDRSDRVFARQAASTEARTKYGQANELFVRSAELTLAHSIGEYAVAGQVLNILTRLDGDLLRMSEPEQSPDERSGGRILRGWKFGGRTSSPPVQLEAVRSRVQEAVTAMQQVTSNATGFSGHLETARSALAIGAGNNVPASLATLASVPSTDWPDVREESAAIATTVSNALTSVPAVVTGGRRQGNGAQYLSDVRRAIETSSRVIQAAQTGRAEQGIEAARGLDGARFVGEQLRADSLPSDLAAEATLLASLGPIAQFVWERVAWSPGAVKPRMGVAVITDWSIDHTLAAAAESLGTTLDEILTRPHVREQ